MIIQYTTFQTLFPNVNITETDFNTIEPFAESFAKLYTQKSLPSTNDVKFAIGLIIQQIVAIGLRAKDLANYSIAGETSGQPQFTDVIPELAKSILDNYKEIVL